MSFQPILRAMVDNASGAVGVALLGSDGIAIEQVMAANDAGRALEEDFGAAGVEFGRILDEIRKASDAVGGGPLRETIVALARFTLILHTVDDETFLVMALLPDGNLGKARYLLRRHLPSVREAL
jgi:predicted regulator of Ras-like GTPase activity (Roadblock/LC7/MglB family)